MTDIIKEGKIHIDQDWIEYMIHVQYNLPHIREFQAYPVYRRTSYAKDTYGKEWISYRGNQSSGESYDELNDKCLMHLSGSVCWRGCRESRLYFTDDEYRGEEMKELYTLWNIIYPMMKERVASTCTNADLKED